MSTSYSMKIRRKDGKLIGETYVTEIVKTILDPDDSLIDTDGQEFGISAFNDITVRSEAEIERLKTEIDRMKDGIFSCVSVDVKEDFIRDIESKEEFLKCWEAARNASLEAIGIVMCLCENLIVRNYDGYDEKGETSEDDDDGEMAYSHWAVRTGEKDSGAHEKIDFCWATDARLSIHVC